MLLGATLDAFRKLFDNNLARLDMRIQGEGE
jgi:hypothetical protein